MIIDSIQLAQGSVVENMTVASGTIFPAYPDTGELFFKSGVGLHCYDGSSWLAVGTNDSYTLPIANSSTLGGVKISGAGLSINSTTGVVSANVSTVFGRTGDVALTSSDITGALGFTPVSGVFSYDIATSIFGKPSDGEVAMRFRACRAYTILSNQTNGQAKSNVIATASTVFTIAKNGTQIGTITFAASSTTGTISIATNVSFAIGDILTITCPATADATLADVDFSLIATQN